MEPIKVCVSVELNLSEDAKNFISSVFTGSKSEVSASAPQIPVSAPASPAPAPAPQVQAPKAPAPAPAPQVQAPQVSTSAPQVQAPAPSPAPQVESATAPSVTIEQVRQALAAKVSSHREEIKSKLQSLGAPSVTKLDPAKYLEMYTFLSSLS